MLHDIVRVSVIVHIYRINDGVFRYRVRTEFLPKKTTGIQFTIACSMVDLIFKPKKVRSLAIDEAWNRATSKDIKRFASSKS